MSGGVTGSVSFRSVSKRYGTVTAVNSISFDIAPATLVTLLGPSGCGKTTTLRLIAGLEQASAGQILIGGKDVTRLSPAERDVSMVFQSYALFPHLNVLENVCYGLRSTRMPRRRAIELARTKLDLVGLVGLDTRLPSELSGGQQQRVALARAMVLEPQVLLFDEPLSNLDARLRRRVRDEIRALQQALGLTVVYVTHDQSEALAISDRIIVMNNASIAQDGPPRELYDLPTSRFVVDFMGEASLLPVEIASVAGDRAEVQVGPLLLNVPRRGGAPGAAILAVRPHAVRLVPDEPQAGSLRGTVRRAVYVGDRMEYDIDLDAPQCSLFAIDSDVVRPLAPGRRVMVTLDLERVGLLPTDQEAG